MTAMWKLNSTFTSVVLNFVVVLNPSLMRAFIRPFVVENMNLLQGEWPSGLASSIGLTEVKHGCVRSETGWATFQISDQNNSLGRPSEGTSN